MDSYLFLAAIGPVQSFIASARRTGDLQFGSWLLSELAKAAAKSIADKYGRDSLIFPAPQSIADLAENTELSVANKIVALIDDSPQDVGKAVRIAINTRLHSIKNRAYKDMGPIEDVIANKQIDDLVEYFWVAAPYNAQDYVVTRTKLENMMAARKNTRDFRKVDWGSNKPKSSIDGQLESVIPDNKYNQRGDSKEVGEKKAKALYMNYEAKPAEYLSGVDLLKRRGHALLNRSPVENFPSTSHMAALPYLERLNLLPTTSVPQIQKIWNEYVTELGRIALSPNLEQIPYTFSPHAILGKYDGSLLFEERLVDMVDASSLSPTDKAKLENVKQKLHSFYKEVDDILGKGHPSPYYAILLADGDRMGKVIDNQKGEKGHRQVSQALDTFARGVQKIVKKYQGALIYSGGDDVLALVPLHTLIACARELSLSFYNELKRGGFQDKDGNKPTLSVGIVIVHHLDPLQDALNLARAAEAKAKSVDGKNGLAITVSKRSGIDYSVVGSWGKIDTYLDQLLPFCIADNIPDGTAYELRHLALRLGVPQEDQLFDMTQKAIQAEAKRILDRKLAPLTPEKKKEVMDVLGPKLGIEGENLNANKAGNIKLVNFTNELLLAQLLADTHKIAYQKKEH